MSCPGRLPSRRPKCSVLPCRGPTSRPPSATVPRKAAGRSWRETWRSPWQARPAPRSSCPPASLTTNDARKPRSDSAPLRDTATGDIAARTRNDAFERLQKEKDLLLSRYCVCDSDHHPLPAVTDSSLSDWNLSQRDRNTSPWI